MLRGCIPDRFRNVSNLVLKWLKFEPRIILVAYAAWLHSGFGFATFEFSFYEWRKFRADTRIILVAYAAWFPDSVSLRFEFSFHNGSSFELILGSFWSRMLRGAFQIRFRYVSNLVSRMAQVSSRQELESQVQQAR